MQKKLHTGKKNRRSDGGLTVQKNLSAKIELSKKLKWEELRNDLNNDPLALGYTIVMKKFGAQINFYFINLFIRLFIYWLIYFFDY